MAGRMFVGAETMVLTACDGAGRSDPAAGTVTLVNRVRSPVKGLRVPRARQRRRRRCAVGSTTSPSPRIRPGQTIDLAFEQSATPFSSASFRQALAEQKVRSCRLPSRRAAPSMLSRGDHRWCRAAPACLSRAAGNFVAAPRFASPATSAIRMSVEDRARRLSIPESHYRDVM